MDLLTHIPNNLYFTLICILGLCIGSFLTVVVFRLPQSFEYSKSNKLPFWHPFSCCFHCQTKLKTWHKIPLASYLALQGQTHCCKKPISRSYILIESLSLLLSALLAFKLQSPWQLIFGLILMWSLLTLSFIDLHTFLLPDQLTLPTLALGLVVNYYELFIPFKDALIGTFVGYLFFYLIAWLTIKIRGIEGLGRGDFKLLALLGAWLGWQMLPMVIFIASLTGSCIGLIYILVQKKPLQVRIPFGPFLAVAGVACLLWGHEILHYQQHLIRFS